jgi:1-acyl-sn-glycerol-3-phosphate acyltransferase
VDCIDREVFQRDGRAVPVGGRGDLAGVATLAFVACGHPLEGHDLRVVDDDGQLVPERTRGHIEFRGPSVTTGYYRRPEATALIRTADGWTRSGDLGYLADGEIFITGRLKDVIIKGGRNIYPAEAEALAGGVAGVRAGCVAAFGAPDHATGTERFVIVAETREEHALARQALTTAIIEAVTHGLGLPPDSVVLAAPGAVLKTSSGKIRRRATRDAFERGTLARGHASMPGQWARLVSRAVYGKLARASARSLSALYTAYIAICLVPGLPILLFGLALVGEPRLARRWLHRWSRAMMTVCALRVAVSGREHLDAAGPQVVVANHASYLDAIVMLALLEPHVVFVVKAGLTSYPVLGFVIRRCGFIRAERGAHQDRLSSADAVSRALAAGQSIFVFPEGTFVRAAGLLPFKLGAFSAAANLGVPVVPMALNGTRRLLPDGTWLVTWTRLRADVASPMWPRGSAWPAVLALRDDARASIGARLAEQAAPVDPETALFTDLY